MLLGGLFALVVPIAHMRGAAISARVIKSDRAFFFILTLLAIGVTGLFSVILAARGLWSLRRARRGSPTV
jgi:amino acid transporter